MVAGGARHVAPVGVPGGSRFSEYTGVPVPPDVERLRRVMGEGASGSGHNEANGGIPKTML